MDRDAVLAMGTGICNPETPQRIAVRDNPEHRAADEPHALAGDLPADPRAERIAHVVHLVEQICVENPLNIGDENFQRVGGRIAEFVGGELYAVGGINLTVRWRRALRHLHHCPMRAPLPAPPAACRATATASALPAENEDSSSNRRQSGSFARTKSHPRTIEPEPLAPCVNASPCESHALDQENATPPVR